MNKLSVVIITYNEESDIGRCLNSVIDIADEIVVVDSYSTDNTELICRQAGAKFYQHKFEGYIEQKNYALTLAANDYILSLDADEALDNELRHSISVAKQDFKYDGYFMNRLTNYCGKWIRHGAWYPDRKLRLFNRQKGNWAGVNPHDSYELKANTSKNRLKGDILHYSYNSIESHIAQFNKFTSLSAIEMHKNGQQAGLLKIYLSPCINFVKGFFLRMGFLDGFYGTMICFINAFATYIKYIKLRQLSKGLKI